MLSVAKKNPPKNRIKSIKNTLKHSRRDFTCLKKFLYIYTLLCSTCPQTFIKISLTNKKNFLIIQPVDTFWSHCSNYTAQYLLHHIYRTNCQLVDSIVLIRSILKNRGCCSRRFDYSNRECIERPAKFVQPW